MLLAMERMVLLLLLLLLVVLLAMLLAISSPAKAGGISRRLINIKQIKHVQLLLMAEILHQLVGSLWGPAASPPWEIPCFRVGGVGVGWV